MRPNDPAIASDIQGICPAANDIVATPQVAIAVVGVGTVPAGGGAWVPLVVARVQTDGRLVEHVERVHELRAERVREADALLARDATLSAQERVGVSLVLAQKPWLLQLFHPYRRSQD